MVTVISLGQTMFGFSPSFTVTLIGKLRHYHEASVAVLVTRTRSDREQLPAAGNCYRNRSPRQCNYHSPWLCNLPGLVCARWRRICHNIVRADNDWRFHVLHDHVERAPARVAGLSVATQVTAVVPFENPEGIEYDGFKIQIRNARVGASV
jgi:hypothetical protein